MAGLYIHVPFCRRRCTYCDFFSGTNYAVSQRYIAAVRREMDAYPDFFHRPVGTIYFGGGTPSSLSVGQLQSLFSAIRHRWHVAADAEVTLEANPDDLSLDYLFALRHMGVNRLSIGIQSLDDGMLRWMNRRHTAAEAVAAVHRARSVGFDNVSVDIIFGLPGQTVAALDVTLRGILALGVRHISAYSLTVENRRLQQLVARRIVTLPSDDQYAAMFEHLSRSLIDAGYDQYEISNYAIPGFESRHNSSYWTGIPYLGIGAGASSYDGSQRWTNLPHTIRYCAAVERGADVRQIETLDDDSLYNEMVFLSLRTKQGIHLPSLLSRFGQPRLDYLLHEAARYLDSGHLEIAADRLRLTRAGIYISDSVMAQLMS